MAVPMDHPAVRRFHEHQADRLSAPTEVDANWLREVCLEAGADDVGFVEIDRAELADQRAEIQAVLPRARALISFVCHMNRDAIRTPARSVSNLEFHLTGDRVDEVARHIVAVLERSGVRAINPAMGFPMEVVIRDQTLEVHDGHQGKADLHLIADSRTWIKFLMKEQNLVWAIARGRIRLKGSPRLLLAFGRCFPA